MDNREKIVRQLFIGKVSEIIGGKKTVELLKEANDAFPETKTDPKKAGLTFKEFQQIAKELSDKINKVKEFPETDTLFDFETMFKGLYYEKPQLTTKLRFANDPPIIPFTAESMVKSMVEFSKSIESTAKHLESLSKNSKPETDLEKKMREAKEAMFQSNLSFEIVTTEMQLSKYLCKNLINRIKERQPDKFKCLMALKAELKFLVDRYGKI